MSKIIGFADRFYTLWNHEIENHYITDSYGNHYVSRIDHKYYYIKNISTDIEKVKSLYPNVEIDNGLRGTNFFIHNEKVELPDGYFWHGKYSGRLISDVIEKDLNYCIWAADYFGGKIAKCILDNPKYVAHLKAIEDEKQAILNSKELLKVGDTVELEFTRNGYNANEEHNECWVNAIYKGIDIAVNCTGYKQVGGMYPYIMPMINGKVQKTKGKKIMVTVTEVIYTTVNHNSDIRQTIKIA